MNYLTMLLIILCALPCLSKPIALRTDDKVIISNENTSFTFNANTGEIMSVTPDKTNLSGKWFEVIEEDRHDMASWEYWKMGKEISFTGDKISKLELFNRNDAAGALFLFKRNGLDIIAEAKLDSDAPGIKLRITVKNVDEKYLVDTINFKIAGMQIGDGSDNFFLYPEILGARVKTSSFPAGKTKEDPYPGFMYMQWLDMYNADAGLYLGSLDDYGYTKKLIIGKNKDGQNLMGVSFSGCWVAKAGDEFTTPYIEIVSHSGDWRKGADIYRKFAQKAFGPIVTPDKIKEMPTSQCWLSHHASNADIWKLFEIQQQAPIHASYLTKSMNTSVPEGWDGFHGSALEYEETFQNIKRLGGSAALFTFDRAPLMGRLNYAAYVGKWTNVKRGGAFEEAFRDLMPSPFDSNFRKARIGEAVRWVRDFGLDELHYDTEGTSSDSPQVITGMLCGPSYRADFPQRPNETPHYFKTLYKETLDAARAYNPDFTLRAEHCGDFFYPEFSASTAHFYYGTLEQFKVNGFKEVDDFVLMPEVFRYTLPYHSQVQMPSVSNNDYWMYSYGMGHGFHGGGPSWSFNPKTRETEIPDGQLWERYTFYDYEWRCYYDFRVGFTESILESNEINTDLTAYIDNKWVPCDFSSDVTAVLNIGKDRQVVLGELQDINRLSEYAMGYKSKFKGNSSLRPFIVKFPVKIKNPKFKLYDSYSVSDISPVVKDGYAQVKIENSRVFAIEAYSGADLNIDIPSKIINPGMDAVIKVNIKDTWNINGKLSFELPSGWQKISDISIPASNDFSDDIIVKIPDGIFGRNYPIKIVYTAGDLKRTVACHIKVMEPITFVYSFDTLNSDGSEKGINALTPGEKGQIKTYIINNTDIPRDVKVNINGEYLKFQKNNILKGISLNDLGLSTSKLTIWLKNGFKGDVPENVWVLTNTFDVPAISSKSVNVEVTSKNQKIFLGDVYPRSLVMDLNGEFKVYDQPNNNSMVGGVEGIDGFNTFYVTSEAWDGNWKKIVTPYKMSDIDRKNSSWSVYRKTVFIPSEWQGSDIFLRLSNMGGPWGVGGTLNVIYLNGWPCGRIGYAGEVSISPFIKFGSINLIGIASFDANLLNDPYLFVRNVPDAKRIKVSSNNLETDGAFVILNNNFAGYGLSLPASKGIGEKDYRRVVVANGGEAVYINVDIADGYMFDIDEDVIVEVEYFDDSGSIALQYDSHDPKGIDNGTFTAADEKIIKKGTNKWVKGKFYLKKAKFANRQFGFSDFRIEALDADLLIKKIIVKKAN